MRPLFHYSLLGVVAVALAGGGYWLGQGPHTTSKTAAVAAPKILYYRNPMGLPDTSPTPKKDPMGMDYIPVFAGDNAAASSAVNGGKGKILYYRNPMGLADTSPTPKLDSMGMDYIPVYESEVSDANHVRLSPEKVQKLGVKLAAVEQRNFSRILLALGRIEIDERAQTLVSPRFEGWIDRLHVSATGQNVSKGQPLFDAYSPEILAAEQEYQLAIRGVNALAGATAEARQGMAAIPETSLRRLELLGVPAEEIARLKRGGEPRRSLSYSAPASGVILEKMAVEGARFMPGEALFKIADLSRVWLMVDLPEQSLQMAKVGAPVAVTLDAYPGERFEGRVDFIYPTLNSETRTAQVRVVLANRNNRLKPGLYARAELTHSGISGIAVPDSAVIDSGKRKVVLVALGEGLYEPREVKTGERGNGYIFILEGLAAGEQVVVSANFLIDAESNLKAALGGLGGNKQGGNAAPAQSVPTVKPDPHAGMDMSKEPAASVEKEGHNHAQ